MTASTSKPLEVCAGNEPGRSFRVRSSHGSLQNVQKQDGNIVTGVVEAGWKEVSFVTNFTGKAPNGSGDSRFLRVEPSDEETQFSFGPFYIKGRFRIVEKINNSREARARWSAEKNEKKT